MGRRGQAAREEAEREREREFVASLPPRDPFWLRIWQISGFGIFVCGLALIVLFVAEARGAATIEPGAIEVVDGDTIRVGPDIYRLVGFNTPEPGSGAQCEAERTLAARATFRLRQLVDLTWLFWTKRCERIAWKGAWSCRRRGSARSRS